MQSAAPTKGLLLTGGEISHFYLANTLRRLGYDFDVIIHHSGRSDFEYYYSIYGVGVSSQEEKDRIVDFVFRRNSTLAKRAPYEMLTRPEGCAVTPSAVTFNELADTYAQKGDYDVVLSYGGPIVTSQAVLQGDCPAYNLHFGLSRHYRGGDTNIYALSEAEPSHVGLTCHVLTAEVDKGDVMFEVAFAPTPDVRCIDQLNWWLLERAIERIPALVNGDCPPVSQDNQGKLFLNRELRASHVLAAERQLEELWRTVT